MISAVTIAGQTGYTDAAAGANSGARYYYLTTVSTSAAPNMSISSDTLATLFLQVTQSVPLGSAVLDWNLQHTPPLATSGTWSTIDLATKTGDAIPIEERPQIEVTHHGGKQLTPNGVGI